MSYIMEDGKAAVVKTANNVDSIFNDLDLVIDRLASLTQKIEDSFSMVLMPSIENKECESVPCANYSPLLNRINKATMNINTLCDAINELCDRSSIR